MTRVSVWRLLICDGKPASRRVRVGRRVVAVPEEIARPTRRRAACRGWTPRTAWTRSHRMSVRQAARLSRATLVDCPRLDADVRAARSRGDRRPSRRDPPTRCRRCTRACSGGFRPWRASSIPRTRGPGSRCRPGRHRRPARWRPAPPAMITAPKAARSQRPSCPPTANRLTSPLPRGAQRRALPKQDCSGGSYGSIGPLAPKRSDSSHNGQDRAL